MTGTLEGSKRAARSNFVGTREGKLPAPFVHLSRHSLRRRGRKIFIGKLAGSNTDMIEHIEKAFRRVINTSRMTRSQARAILKGLLVEHGWRLIEDSELGDIVAYLRNSGVFIIVKLWLHPDRAAVPRFYVEKFLKALFKTSDSCHKTPIFDKSICQECERFCLLSKRVYKYFVSNAPLDQEAYNYFRSNGKSTRLILSDAARQDVRKAMVGDVIIKKKPLDLLDMYQNPAKDVPASRQE